MCGQKYALLVKSAYLVGRGIADFQLLLGEVTEGSAFDEKRHLRFRISLTCFDFRSYG